MHELNGELQFIFLQEKFTIHNSFLDSLNVIVSQRNTNVGPTNMHKNKNLLNLKLYKQKVYNVLVFVSVSDKTKRFKIRMKLLFKKNKHHIYVVKMN